MLLIFPLFLAYQVGILFTPSVNGVDFVSAWLYEVAGSSRNYLLIHAALAVLFLGVLLYWRRTRGFSLDMLAPMLLESTIYALTLGSFIVFVMDEVLGMPLAWIEGWTVQLADSPVTQALVVSLGAGVHEELVFRLGMFGGGAALATLAGLPRGWSVALALIASSVVFSAAHHLGPAGEVWDVAVFTYRTLAGAIFAVIFYYRSLAHAVYTHFLYDVYVFVVR